MPILENLIGFPLYMALMLRFWPDRFPEKIEVNITKNDSKYTRTKTFLLSSSGLWLPSN